jgi:hypothetical protein
MRTLVLFAAISIASLATLSAHVVKGLGSPHLATAFVSSPSAGADAPIRIAWGTAPVGMTSLRVVCFYAANTSTPRVDRPDWPRVTAVGFELPGAPSGFALMTPIDGDWELVEGVEATVPGPGTVTLDFAIVARVNPTGRTPGKPHDPRGIPPGQLGQRGQGIRFCVSGPFPDVLPNRATADPEDIVPTTIEGLIDGVAVGFHGVEGNDQGTDVGVWFPPLPGTTVPGPDPRIIPLYP